jgi:hypothetical protein
MGNRIEREVRNQWETKKGMKKTINQQSHIINEQSHSSMCHGYKKAIMNLTLHAQTFRCPLEIKFLCGSSGILIH